MEWPGTVSDRYEAVGGNPGQMFRIPFDRKILFFGLKSESNEKSNGRAHSLTSAVPQDAVRLHILLYRRRVPFRQGRTLLLPVDGHKKTARGGRFSRFSDVIA
jgi:hypothetical protein